jgi:hypothetical protein
MEQVSVQRRIDALRGWMFTGNMKPVLPGAYFTIEVDGRPIVVFHAERLAQARELTHEQWLREDLCRLKCNGEPVCTPTSKLIARYASGEEIAASARSAGQTEANGDEIVFTYLIKPDNVAKNWFS